MYPTHLHAFAIAMCCWLGAKFYKLACTCFVFYYLLARPVYGYTGTHTHPDGMKLQVKYPAACIDNAA